MDISRGIARFSMAECLSRLLLAGGAETLSLLEEFLIFSEQLVFFKEDGSEAVVKCRNAKGTIATTILILLKQTFVRYREDKTSCVVSFLHLDRMCVILLRLLGTLEKITSDSDPLIQVSCDISMYLPMYDLFSLRRMLVARVYAFVINLRMLLILTPPTRRREHMGPSTMKLLPT